MEDQKGKEIKMKLERLAKDYNQPLAKEATLSNQQEEQQIFAIHPYSQDTLKGYYSNVTNVHHTKNEFIFDFFFNLNQEKHLVYRIILSPEHVRQFVDAVNRNYEMYKGNNT